MASYNKGIVKYVRKRLDESRAGWNDYYRRQNTANTIGAIGQAGAQIIGAYGQRQENQRNEAAAIQLGSELGFSPEVSSRLDVGTLAKAALSVRQQKREDDARIQANSALVAQYGLDPEQYQNILGQVTPDRLLPILEARAQAAKAGGLGGGMEGAQDALKFEQGKAQLRGTRLDNQLKAQKIAGSGGAEDPNRLADAPEGILNSIAQYQGYDPAQFQQVWAQLTPEKREQALLMPRQGKPSIVEEMALAGDVANLSAMVELGFIKDPKAIQWIQGIQQRAMSQGQQGSMDGAGALPAPGMNGQPQGGAPAGNYIDIDEILNTVQSEDEKRAQFGGR